MQKHQQWLDNRTYDQHLHCLQRIRGRKNFCSTATTNNKNINRRRLLKDHQLSHQKQNSKTQYIKSDQQQDLQKQKHNQTPQFNEFKLYGNNWRSSIGINSNFSTNALTLKQRNLLWDNFLIGKRIIQTPPVICKKKLDNQYRKHLQLLRSRNKSKKCNQFRSKRLLQYSVNKAKIADDMRIYSVQKKYILILNIMDFKLFKSKTIFENIQLSFYQSSSTKKLKQYSQYVCSQQFPFYNFYFNISHKQLNSNKCFTIQMKTIKSLEGLIIGQFQFLLDGSKFIEKEVNLMKIGKIIGLVKYQISIVKRMEMINKQYTANISNLR